MNSCEPISISATPASLWKCGTTCSAISSPCVAMTLTQLALLHGRPRARNSRSLVIPLKKTPAVCLCKFDTIRALGEALLSSGRLCRKNGTCYLKYSEKAGFRMRVRLDAALAALAVCAVACALLWPHARAAGALLEARDDPAALSDLELNSALRNGPDAIEQNIEAALAANDADLANSFGELAAAR